MSILTRFILLPRFLYELFSELGVVNIFECLADFVFGYGLEGNTYARIDGLVGDEGGIYLFGWVPSASLCFAPDAKGILDYPPGASDWDSGGFSPRESEGVPIEDKGDAIGIGVIDDKVSFQPIGTVGHCLGEVGNTFGCLFGSVSRRICYHANNVAYFHRLSNG